MDRFEQQQKSGELFISSYRSQQIFARVCKASAALSVSLGTINYFIAPDERLTYTMGPYLCAAAMLIGNTLLGRATDKLQDTVIDMGMQDFEDTE